MDDVKSSHAHKEVQDAFENWLIDKYDRDQDGKIVGKIKKCEGKRLDYIGMVLDYSVPGEVTIDMVDYTNKMVKEFEEQIGQIKVT